MAKRERHYLFSIAKSKLSLTYYRDRLKQNYEKGLNYYGEETVFDEERAERLRKEIAVLTELIDGLYGYPAARLPRSIWLIARHATDSGDCSRRANLLEKGRYDLLQRYGL